MEMEPVEISPRRASTSHTTKIASHAEFEILLKNWWDDTGMHPGRFQEKITRAFFRARGNYTLNRDYMVRRARKIRDALNVLNPVYPELRNNPLVDLGPAEHMELTRADARFGF